jgi:hypothetical protein
VNFYKFLREWMLPPNVCKWAEQAYFELGVGISSEDLNTAIRNITLRSKYSGEKCFVIGNGPSLNSLDLSLLKYKRTIAMNRFDKNPALAHWQPGFLCMLDPIKTFDDPEMLKEFTEPFAGVTPKDGYVVHISMKPIVEKLGAKLYRTYFVKTSIDVKDIGDTGTEWDLTRQIPGGWSTSVLGIALAMYLGSKEIYLLGMDHNWLAEKTFYSHFYDAEDSQKQSSYTDLMEYALKVFQGYKVVKQYADRRGIKIFNATPGSYLDIFPYVDYNTIFEEKT